MWSRRKDNMRLNTGVARERRQFWNRITIRCKCINMAIYNWLDDIPSYAPCSCLGWLSGDLFHPSFSHHDRLHHRLLSFTLK